jgi:type IV pilus assembly protein PilA
METGKSVARLRRLRELLGRTGSGDEGEEREAGFTLIELMVVLLIMGILLAIAIPTFLSVTGGAKKTAAQSDLTNAYTSLQGVYSGNSGTLPQKTTAPTLGAVITDLGKTQTSIKFQSTKSAAKGANTVSVALVTTTKTAVLMAARDGAGYCWMVLFNDTGTLTGTPAGPKYVGFYTKTATTVSPSTTCTAGALKTKVTTAAAATNTGWKTGWKTITTPKT